MTIAELLNPPHPANNVFDEVRDLLLENGRPKTWAHVSAVADVCVGSAQLSQFHQKHAAQQDCCMT